MAEWLVEQGIAEHRAVLLDKGAITAARVDWPGRLAAGLVADATLIHRTTGSRRGTLRFDSGEEALADNLPTDAAEGARLRVRVTRGAIAETGRLKGAQARPTTAPARPAPSLVERLAGARVVPRFPDVGWDELIAEAFDGIAAFAGGSLTISPTPAMTVIDVDGTLAPAALALAAVPMLAATLLRHDIGGSVGIDFPTLSSRAERQALDRALAAALDEWPHERTAINGFGFVQIVSRLERPSLFQLARADPAGLAARLLLRRAEAVRDPGALLITAHPAVLRCCRADWREALARRTGRALHWREDAGLALNGGFAQAIAT